MYGAAGLGMMLSAEWFSMITISTWSYRGTAVAATADGGATVAPSTSPATSSNPTALDDDDRRMLAPRLSGAADMATPCCGA